MKIIGHRGAAGLALENTIAAIKAGKAAGVDAIEIDVRQSSDGKLVVIHDASLRRISESTATISATPYTELRSYRLANGERLLNLHEALRACSTTPLVIEAKSGGWAATLHRELRGVAQPYTVIAQDHAELARFKQLMPEVPTYLVQRFNPIDVFQALQDARRYGFTGVDLNFWLLNPFTYMLAKRYKLDIIVYTVNVIWIARFLARLFPDISITTNHPERLQFLRTNKE